MYVPSLVETAITLLSCSCTLFVSCVVQASLYTTDGLAPYATVVGLVAIL
jgi:hypothetical protein